MMCASREILTYCLSVGILAHWPMTAKGQPDPFGLEQKPSPRLEVRVSAERSSEDPAVLSPGTTTDDAGADDAVAAAEQSRPTTVITVATGASYDRIRQALNSRVSAEFQQAPMAEVVAFLQDAALIPIVFDRRALDDVGYGTDMPITISVQGISLRSCLEIMLSELELTYVVRDEVLSITTPEDAERELEICLYDVADLGHVDTSPLIVTRLTSRYELICDLIRTNVEPHTWVDVGGPGSLVARDEWNCLVISQTHQVHRSIEALLNALRRARSVGRGLRAVENAVDDWGPIRVLDEAERAARTHIEKALASEANLDFIDAPLLEVVAHLKDRYSLPVSVDRRALDDVGLGCDTPVTISLRGVSLRSALRMMLRELDLVYTLEDELLKITTPEEAESDLVGCVFPVTDLVAPGTGPIDSGRSGDSLDSLIRLITTTVAPDAWDEVGGPGSISDVAPWGLLVVTQTEAVQQQIRDLLAAARRMRTDAEPSTAAPVPSSDTEPTIEPSMVLRPYPLMGVCTTPEVTRLIMGTIEPGSWRQREGAASIFPLGNLLLIRQTPEAHDKIRELFQSLQSLHQRDGFFGPQGIGGGTGSMPGGSF